MDKAHTQEAATQFIGERRGAPRFFLLSRVDVSIPGCDDTYWGGLANISQTGVALSIRQRLKPNTKVTLRLRFQSDDGREVTETLSAKVIWHCGDSAGLKFETPLTAGSPAAQHTPYLLAHVLKKEQSTCR